LGATEERSSTDSTALNCTVSLFAPRTSVLSALFLEVKGL
jgi:hypothetical protein